MANATLRYQTNAIFITNKPSINYYPVNPLILVILIWLTPRYAIRQIQLSSPNKPSINYYPVNPLILVILILTNGIFITKQTIYKLPSC